MRRLPAGLPQAGRQRSHLQLLFCKSNGNPVFINPFGYVFDGYFKKLFI